ncbi:hypothetical protein [Pseudonocardia sp. H11422]|uniref:hypothetical protein n=1 Tax=Pseudonocardia sp. H11422 TaxID=2835866 RepID=UPI001BDC13BB|nr:hypothetical protein [Pseudonocardia sp. H11422]
MTKTQAMHVNTLMRWLLDLNAGYSAAVTGEEARESAAYLADQANAALGAGVRGSQVHDCWPGATGHRVSPAAERYLCAYCKKSTAAEDAAAGPWRWPGRGMVVNCRTCAGIVTCPACGRSWDPTMGEESDVRCS